MMQKQYDAHVKARKALARKVVARRYDWGLTSGTIAQAFKKTIKEGTYDEFEQRLLNAAYGAIADYRWSENWGDKYSAYSPYTGSQVIGIHKNVPVHCVHAIMCKLDEHFR